jgi:hypothetical protein
MTSAKTRFGGAGGGELNVLLHFLVREILAPQILSAFEYSDGHPMTPRAIGLEHLSNTAFLQTTTILILKT